MCASTRARMAGTATMRTAATGSTTRLRRAGKTFGTPLGRYRVADGCFTTVIPHGPRPTGIFFVTCFVATSITDKSFDGPLAV